jgi:hypothetical protein
MKEIDQMTLPECIEALQSLEEFTLLKDIDTGNFEPTYDSMKQNAVELADRIHDLTRWVPVSERMPTGADCTKIKYAQHLNVLAMDVFGDVRVTNYSLVTESHGYKAWQRITPPEAP